MLTFGMPQKITDSSGVTIWNAEYKPFGEATVTTNGLANNLRFPGQYFDAETGLHYNYFRDYNPAVGRYIEADPIGLRGGVNLYAYVENNPVNLIDPIGLEFISPGEAQKLVDEFKTWLGTPYRRGGRKKGPKGGADCSHSTNQGYINAQFPYSYSDTSSFSSNHSFKSVPNNDPQIGDVGLWDDHMAVYAGDGKIFTAHRPSGNSYSVDRLSDWIKSKGSKPVWYRYYRPDK